MLPVGQIIEFRPDTSERKKYFNAASFAHPAKMVLGLQIYLIEHYTKPGDVILDPMTGSGTILIACTLGRNVVCVELEEKFVKMQQDNWAKIKSLGPMLGFTMGEATILQGDARNLDGLLADNIVFSPPYARDKGGEKGMLVNDPKRKDGNLYRTYSHNPSNIDNLSYGEISAVISSPPYESSEHNYKHGLKVLGKNFKGRKAWETKGKADAVITSPPYEQSLTDGHTKKRTDGTSFGYTDVDENVQRLRNHGRTDPKAGGAYGRSLAHPYSGAAENIGNLKSENYLQAMLAVYRQCHKVLKEKGFLVLVTKNFIRDKKIVRLDLDTIKLCEQAGFVLKETLQRKLTQQSFWRTIYHKKFPDVEKIEYEDVLVFEKGQ